MNVGKCYMLYLFEMFCIINFGSFIELLIDFCDGCYEDNGVLVDVFLDV